MELAGVGPLVAGSVALGTAVIAIPMTPRRYWGWRLRKHMETVDSLDNERHANQREVLLRTADKLASRVASIHAVPTYWYAWIDLYLTIGMVTAVTWGLATSTFPAVPADWVTVVFAPIFLLISVRQSVVMRRQISEDRRRFIARGCPVGFVTTLKRGRRNHALPERALRVYRIQRRRARAAQLAAIYARSRAVAGRLVRAR